MEKRWMDTLRRRYGAVLSDTEIRQEVALAELRAGGQGPLAFRMANFALLNRLQWLARWYARFECLWSDGVVEHEGMSTHDAIFEAMCEEEEWERTLSTLPYPAQKLAKIATRQAESADLSCRMDALAMAALRGKIREEFVAWERSHSVKAYYRWRSVLIEAMRRYHRTKCGRGEG